MNTTRTEQMIYCPNCGQVTGTKNDRCILCGCLKE